MRQQSTSLIGAGWRAWVAPVLALWVAVSLAGCDALIDVENPNNVNAEDLESPSAAPAIVSGVLFEVADAHGSALTPYATATDELKWVGSRDSWKVLEQGDLSQRTNEFSDAAFPDVAEARWLADEAIRLLTGFDDEGELADRLHLAQAYLIAAIIYAEIADRWDDFVISSDKMEAGPAVGPANMSQLYDTADGYLTSGLAIAQAEGDTDFETTIKAMRVSVAHRKAIWGLINPPLSGTATSPMYVGVSTTTDATDVIADIGGTDWVYRFNYDDATITNNIGVWVNERLEHRIDDRYGVAGGADNTITAIALMDPIDTTEPDGAVTLIVDDFVGALTGANNRDVGSLWVTSEREMYLILAETEYAASGDDADPEAVGYINALRALDGTTAYDPAVHTTLTVGDMIRFHRQGNLFLQGRRLSDMYRFGITDTRWIASSEAINSPGTFLPITDIECRANPGVC